MGQAASNIEFRCQVAGSAHLKPALASTEVCAKFKEEIDKALGATTRSGNMMLKASSARWISVKVRLDGQYTASAYLFRHGNGRTVKYREIVIDVMDKAIDQRDIAMLARETAKLVARK